MKQAEKSNIIIGPWAHSLSRPTPIEALWKRFQTVSREKRRVYALWDEAWASGDAADCDRAEAACDAVFEALESIADEILRSRPTAAIDLAIKARVLVGRDHGNGYLASDIERFCRDVQIAAGSLSRGA